MNKQELIELIKRKKSFLCVGLDTDLTKIPRHLLKYDDPVFEFNKQIIDATYKITVAFKLNLAFYECRGVKGMQSFEKTIHYLKTFEKNLFTIADAKRGDIGNTSKLYAKAFFETFDFDAITVSPYMGSDSVMPFLDYKEKWVILLALTSNKGADDFQLMKTDNMKDNNMRLFEQVIVKSSTWGLSENMMYVVGATKAKLLQDIRKIIPDYFLLIPGVGAQGGSIEEVSRYGMNKHCGLLVNASRSIIYASSENNFAEKAYQEALTIQQKMENLLINVWL